MQTDSIVNAVKRRWQIFVLFRLGFISCLLDSIHNTVNAVNRYIAVCLRRNEIRKGYSSLNRNLGRITTGLFLKIQYEKRPVTFQIPIPNSIPMSIQVSIHRERLYSTFPEKRDSKWSSEWKVETQTIDLGLFSNAPPPKPRNFAFTNLISILMTISSLIFTGKGWETGLWNTWRSMSFGHYILDSIISRKDEESFVQSILPMLLILDLEVEGEVGGWGRVPFSRNFMKPTPRRKWYLTTGRRFH